ncbi:MAG: HIT family protein, partial [Nitrososphaerales archaeon]|nr:HIT family protein [Nitrososphaerales archaeon]
ICKYRYSLPMESCIFCNLNESQIVEQCDAAIVIRDQYPVSKGHTLIIPRRHVETFFEATDDEVVALMYAVRKAKEQLDEELSPDGYNIGINSGEVAGQTGIGISTPLALD